MASGRPASRGIAPSGLSRPRARGALLVTHWGLSGPVVLRLSAWGARVLHRLNYRFPLQLNWLPHLDAEAILEVLANFLSNARRFSPDGGAIKIGARRSGEVVEIYIQDRIGTEN